MVRAYAQDDPEFGAEFFIEVVETVGVGVVVYDSSGQFRYVNEAYASLLETDRAALEGTGIWEINPQFDSARFEEYWNSFEEGSTKVHETIHRLGEVEIPVQTVTTRRTIGNTPYHFGTVQDISTRKERERTLEEQNERLDEFASVISHDLRNPLSVALTRLELAQQECESDHLDHVATALDRMNDLIDDVLTYAREGDQAGEMGPVDLPEFSRICWQNTPTADARLVVETDRTIRADRKRLQQLLMNLMRNAIEHGGEDVTVTIGDLETGFYIEDDGPGIPPDERDRVFEEGYSTSTDGTGFGLNIVTQVAEAHDWNVHITDGPDGGARFEITDIEGRE